MTDPRPTPRRRPARATGRSALAVYATCAALFLLVTGLLGVRVAQGQDPSLGAANPAQLAQAQAQPARRVLVRKVIVTRHVTVIRAASPGSGGGANAPVRSSAPVVTAAPAPAPAPAPVRTATS